MAALNDDLSDSQDGHAAEASSPTYTKSYPTVSRLNRALQNHLWLKELRTCQLAEVSAVDRADARVELGWVHGRHPRLDDVDRVCRELGRFHGTLLTEALAPRLAELPGFAESRVDALAAAMGNFSAPAQMRENVERFVLLCDQQLPQAIYKDSNLRNLVIEDETVTHLDYDDLTRAPIGYDLAKFLLSVSLTFGVSPPIDAALAAYCDSAAVAGAERQLLGVPPGMVEAMLEINWLLTAPYAGANGYIHAHKTRRSVVEWWLDPRYHWSS